MSQKAWILIGSIAVLIVGLFIWRAYVAPKTLVVSKTAALPASGLQVVSQSLDEHDSAGAYVITAQYPVVTGISAAGALAINTAMKQAVQSDITDFIGNQQGNTDSSDDGNNQSTLDVTFATSTDPVPGVVTFRVDQNFYTAGAAHPGEQIDTYTFDLNTGTAIGLTDLFTGEYLDALSLQSKTLVQQGLGSDADPGQIAEGTDPSDATNFADFMPETDGLHIIFNQYQVASYAQGVQEITIPYASLQTVINPSGALASFAQ